MVSNSSNSGRSSQGRFVGTTQTAQECALCCRHRLVGSVLPSRPEMVNEMLWICADCQHKLSRRIDDEGVLGG